MLSPSVLQIMSMAAMLFTSNQRRISSYFVSGASFAPPPPSSSSLFRRRIHNHNYNRCLCAVESRQLRFYNSIPIDERLATAEATTILSTTATSSSAILNSYNSSDGDINANSQNEKIDTPQLDLTQQVAYVSSLFKKSNQTPSTYFIKTPQQQQKEQQPQGRRKRKTDNPFPSFTRQYSTKNNNNNKNDNGYTKNMNQNNEIHKGPRIYLTQEEAELFDLLSQVITTTHIDSTLRVAGGWVRDKLLATEEFQRRGSSSAATAAVEDTTTTTTSSTISSSSSFPDVGLVERLTSKYQPSIGRQGTKLIGLPKKSTSLPAAVGTTTPSLSLMDQHDLPVDIDIALDDMLGREFADHLNEWLTLNGQETISVGVVLKNPEKSKHLETATMKVGKFWIDFVNLRAEEYTEDSRIPDLMRIGTAEEDAYRRDLTINALFYNINTGQVEDFTGTGCDDLKKGIIATPLPALTTLLDDPLRVLRSVRFAARLRFTIDDSLRMAAENEKVRVALAHKVARERIGAEVDLMLRSQDPVGAMRLLINLNLAGTVFPMNDFGDGALDNILFTRGLKLLSTTHDHLVDCKINVPIWCEKKRVTAAANYGVNEVVLMEDEELRRKLWYASFLKPLRDHSQAMAQDDKDKVGRRQGKKSNRSVIMKLMIDELKRPVRDTETVEAIMKGADKFTALLLQDGGEILSTNCLYEEIRIIKSGGFGEKNEITCHMGENVIDSETEDDPIWKEAMRYRLSAAKIVKRLGHLWRAAMILSLSEQLADLEGEELNYNIEGDVVSAVFDILD